MEAQEELNNIYELAYQTSVYFVPVVDKRPGKTEYLNYLMCIMVVPVIYFILG